MASHHSRRTRPSLDNIFARLRQSRLGIMMACGVACLLLTATFAGWLLLRGSGASNADQQLARVIENEQRPDGFFVFSTQDQNPPIIAETYFAVASLRALHQGIPHADQLATSLTALENAADTAMRNGQPTLGPRDLYEVFMIHRLVGLSLSAQTLAPYTKALQSLFAQKTPSQQYGALHDWYYAVESLALVGLTTPSEQANIARVASALFGSAQATQLPLIEVAYVVDASATAHVELTSPQIQAVTTLLRHSQTTDGGFVTTKASDMLSSYFAMVMARDLHLIADVNLPALSKWITKMRTANGYHVTAGDAPNPLGTLYALYLRSLINGADANGAAR